MPMHPVSELRDGLFQCNNKPGICKPTSTNDACEKGRHPRRLFLFPRANFLTTSPGSDEQEKLDRHMH